MSAPTRQFYHNNPDSPPRSPLSPCHPSPYNPAIRFANNRLSTYSDVSIHDLSDFCEDDLDDYLEDPTFQTHLSTDNLIDKDKDKDRNGHLDKLYGGILGSQQWSFGMPKKPQSVDYDLGNWSKTSAMMLSEPPKRKYLLAPKLEPVVDEKPEKGGVDEAKEHAKAANVHQASETSAEDMSKAPAQAISFAKADFFSRHEKAMVKAFRGEKENGAPFYKKHRMIIIGVCALFMVLAIVLIALGATGHFNSDKVIQATPSESSRPMAMSRGSESSWKAPPREESSSDSFVPHGGSGASVDRASGVAKKPSFALSGQGEGTFYSPGVGVGACGKTHSDTELVAALNMPQFGAFIDPADSPACGACVKIKGPKGSINVKVVDKCPGCKHGDMDLSPAAFKHIADMVDGRVKISWGPC